MMPSVPLADSEEKLSHRQENSKDDTDDISVTAS